MADDFKVSTATDTVLTLVNTNAGVAVVLGTDGGQELANDVADALALLAQNSDDPEQPVYAYVDNDDRTLTLVDGLRRFEA
jgi:hypothetical protein